MVTFTMTFTDP